MYKNITHSTDKYKIRNIFFNKIQHETRTSNGIISTQLRTISDFIIALEKEIFITSLTQHNKVRESHEKKRSDFTVEIYEYRSDNPTNDHLTLNTLASNAGQWNFHYLPEMCYPIFSPNISVREWRRFMRTSYFQHTKRFTFQRVFSRRENDVIRNTNTKIVVRISFTFPFLFGAH